MSNNEKTFQTMSREVACRFLQTVVAVDDQAYLTQADEAPIGPVIEPGFADVVSEQADDGTSIQPVDKQHKLNAKELIDAFAVKGLICSILRPTEQDESILDKVLSAARRADLVILDWRINQDQGEQTKEIITEILSSDTGRLRLIAVYTGNSDIAAIAEDVHQHLQQHSIAAQISPNDSCLIESGNARIEIFSKHYVIANVYENRKVHISDLPDRLIESFSTMTEGIVSNVAVSAISDIRENTYHLLSKLHKELSGPYLVQRALTNPDDAYDFLISLVSDQLHSILLNYNKDDGHGDLVEMWLAQYGPNEPLRYVTEGDEASVRVDHVKEQLEKHPKSKTVQVKTGAKSQKTIEIPVEQIRGWVIKGEPIGNVLNTDKLYNQVSEYLCGKDGKALNAELAMLATLRTKYGNTGRDPILTLGTIVECQGSYWLCIQPRCDSVRLRETTTFPFLRLEFSTKKFDLIVQDVEGAIAHLKVVNRPSKSCMVEFEPNDEILGAVRTKDQEGRRTFISSDDRSWNWIADLKEGYAQRIINQYASNISRVGLDELEWLRLSAK